MLKVLVNSWDNIKSIFMHGILFFYEKNFYEKRASKSQNLKKMLGKYSALNA